MLCVDVLYKCVVYSRSNVAGSERKGREPAGPDPQAEEAVEALRKETEGRR